MTSRLRRARAFTLIELMIVVAIIGILAAIAVPNFLRFQLRAKSVEAGVNLQAISKAEESHFAEYGSYVSVPVPVPAAIPGPMKVAWPGSPAFSQLGWTPEGSVYFQYVVTADNGGPGTSVVRYTAEAAADLDADGQASFFAYVKPAAGAGVGLDGVLPGTTCVGTGVYSGGTPNAVSTAGPCDSNSGRSRF